MPSQTNKTNRPSFLASVGALEERKLMHGGHDGMSHSDWLQSQGGHGSGCGCACCSRGGLVVDGLLESSGNQNADENPSDPSGAPTLNETFSLHSNPGAEHTIFLDFDGHTFSNTIWNRGRDASITSSAFNVSGGSSFTASELDRIYRIWQRVAEDFLPFDVNVTTQDPGTAALSKSGRRDDDWGIRVVVGGSHADWYGASAGGVAYVGSFNWSSDTPTFVFSESLGNNEKYVAEAISHEAGHTLGLSHDGINDQSYYRGHGSGQTGWAAILGAGYTRNLTQWSKGEYAGANQFQDDLAILTGNNGFGYRSDDFGNSIGTAYELTATSNAISASGLIERNTDRDFFSFTTGSGQVDLDFAVAERGPNLDLLVSLYDANGSLVLTSNPSDRLTASISTILDAGIYYVAVEGTGKGEVNGTGYSDYGSLGQYSFSGLVQAETPAVTPDIAISDAIANERDGTVTLTVSLSEPTRQRVGVRVYTQNGTATAGNDFSAFNQTITFAAGETSKQVVISLNDDAAVEATENFYVRLADASNGTIVDNTARVAVISDDVPALSVSNVTVNESDGTATLTVSLDRASYQTVTVYAYTQNGTATAGSDYIAFGQTLTFAAGQTSQQVTISLIDDHTVESIERFYLKLSSEQNATVSDRSGAVSLNSDDQPATPEPDPQPDPQPQPNHDQPSNDSPPSSNPVFNNHQDANTERKNGNQTGPTISIKNKRGHESKGRKGFVFKITLSEASDKLVKATFKTLSDTAVAGKDFKQVKKAVRFKPGQTEKWVRVPIKKDTLNEGTEQFRVKLNHVKGATIGRDTARGTILDAPAAAAIPARWALTEPAPRTTLTLTDEAVDPDGFTLTA